MIRVVIIALVVLPACKDKPAEVQHDPGRNVQHEMVRPAVVDAANEVPRDPDAVAKFDAIRKRMCECKDAACAQAVSEDWKTFATSGVIRAASDKELDAMGPIEIALNGCKEKLIPRDQW